MSKKPAKSKAKVEERALVPAVLLTANLPEDLDPSIMTPFDHWDVEMPGVWKCTKSPTGMCIYHPDTDPCQDSCLYCHEPRERK